MINYKSIPQSSSETWICATMNDTIDEHSSAKELIEKVNNAKGRMEAECLSALRAMNVTPSPDAILFGLVDVVGHRSMGERFYGGYNYRDEGISSGIEVMARTLTNID